MSKTKAEIKDIEYYLSDVDQYLVSNGVDPRERLEYIDEAADSLLRADAGRPDEEFGPSKQYASDLAEALGVSPLRAWWRLLALFVGTWLASLCFGGLFVFYFPLGAEGLDEVFWFNPLGDVPTALMFTFSAWLIMTPSGVRTTGVGRGRLERLIRFVGLIALMIAIVVIWFSLVNRNNDLDLEVASLRVMLPILVVGFVAGLALIWRSRWPQIMLAVATTAKARPDSSLTFNPFGSPTVKVFAHNPPPPLPSGSPDRPCGIS